MRAFSVALIRYLLRRTKNFRIPPSTAMLLDGSCDQFFFVVCWMIVNPISRDTTVAM